MTTAEVHEMSPAMRKKIRAKGGPAGTPFDPYDRLFSDWGDGKVFDVDRGKARDLREMLTRDGKARMLEQVLALPLRAAPWEIRKPKGDTGQTAMVTDQIGDWLGRVLDQMTGAIVYRKAFFEREYDLDGSNVVLKNLHWRPPVSCEAAFDSVTGKESGFRQRVAGLDLLTLTSRFRSRSPGYIELDGPATYIYTHGTHREPIMGTSDLDVTYWAYENRQKLLFLWFQFLESQSLPKTLVYGSDPTQAQENAEAIAELKASGVLPWSRTNGDPNARAFDVLESSGKGAGQFLEAIRYLESMQSQSVLASFMDLATQANEGRGSYALSADHSEFYSASRQAVADEMAHSVTQQVIRPLVVWNFGPDAPMPWLHIGPLSKAAIGRGLDMLGKVITTPNVQAPQGFTELLMLSTASHLGLEPDQIQRLMDEQDKRDREIEKATAKIETPGALDDEAQDLSRRLDTSFQLVRAARAGYDPADLIAGRPAAGRIVSTGVELAGAEDSKRTGGMIALLPRAEDARRLAVEGGEPVEDLHVTLHFLGDEVDQWDQQRRLDVLNIAAVMADQPGPVVLNAWARAEFNPSGDNPCAVYLMGGSTVPQELHDRMDGRIRHVLGALYHEQHVPYVPHLTVGYSLNPTQLDQTGPVVFDRLQVALAGEKIEFPLGPRPPVGEDVADQAADLARGFDPGLHPRDGDGKFTERGGAARRVTRAGGDGPSDVDDTQLEADMQAALAAGDMDRFDALSVEMDRRDQARLKATQDRSPKGARQRKREEQAQKYEDLLASGVDDEVAVQEAYGISPEQQRMRAAVHGLMDAGYRGPEFDGKGFEPRARAAYKDEVYNRYIEAENATRGHMLNKDGQARGIDPQSLFTGNEARARKYASDELKAHWDSAGRVSYQEFRSGLLNDSGQIRRIRGQRGDFLT